MMSEQHFDVDAATPAGVNKSHRDFTRLLLVFAATSLLIGRTVLAAIFAAVSTIIIKRGVMQSGKNIKWLLLAVITFFASILSYAFTSGYRIVSEDKAYELKFRLWFVAKFIEVTWGSTLALFLASAYTSDWNHAHTPSVPQEASFVIEDDSKKSQ
jgi:hypothetical protein